MSVTFVRWDAPARLYAALARLDLGPDAASLFDPSLPAVPWAAGLLEAYRGAPGRLEVHAIGLVTPGDLQTRLRERPTAGLCDAAGRRLCLALADAMAELASSPIEYAAVPNEILAPLTELRDALWERKGGAPPLTIADCPALRHAGRATSTPGGRVVAVSLAEPAEHVLCQVLHEETHVVTDPVVAGQWSAQGPARDTAVGSAGYERHQALETAAVEVGEAVIAARAPGWLGAYHRWRARYGV